MPWLIVVLLRSTNHRAAAVAKKEYILAFVDRFRGLPSKQLIHTGFGTSSHVGEILAIKLNNNANLPENTLQNDILQLISQAQSRVEQNEVVFEGANVGFSVIQQVRKVSRSLVQTIVLTLALSLPATHERTKITHFSYFHHSKICSFLAGAASDGLCRKLKWARFYCIKYLLLISFYANHVVEGPCTKAHEVDPACLFGCP